MKKLIFLGAILIVGSALMLSCSKKQLINENRSSEKQESIFFFPEGTQFNLLENSENSMEFTLPNGYEFITMNEEQTEINSVSNGGTITNNYTSSDSGCKPIRGEEK
jgi:hypothetical protein